MKCKDISALCGVKLRTVCMVIGYLHLVSSIVDICYHVHAISIITNGFQCDVNSESLQILAETQSLDPIRLCLNLGTHGFYPFPHIISYQFNNMEPMTSTPRCYPGVLHVYIIDVLSFVVNLIWLSFLIRYVKALHKRSYESMGMFICLFAFKVVVQITFTGYYPSSFTGFIYFKKYWVLKVLDSVIACFLFMIIKTYAKVLRAETRAPKVEEKTPTSSASERSNNTVAADTTRPE